MVCVLPLSNSVPLIKLLCHLLTTDYFLRICSGITVIRPPSFGPMSQRIEAV
jgi:hypothetical protein